jgi:type IV pilus assembly protein PilB
MIPFKDLSQDEIIKDLYKEEEEELVQVLSDKYGLPYIDLRNTAPEPDALRTVKETLAKEAGLVPFKITGRKLYVAILTPNNKKAEELISSLEARGMEIFLYLSSHASLEHAWGRYVELEQSSSKESGTLLLTKERLLELAKDMHTLDDVKRAFEKTNDSQILYRTSRVIELVFAGALAFDASDIHIEPEETKVRLRYRLDGVLVDVVSFDASFMKLMVSRLKLLSGLKLSTTGNSQDGRFTIDLDEVSVEVRVSVIPGNYGESFVMRLLDPRHLIGDLSELTMSPLVLEKIERAIGKPNGIVLVTGPTGSGKSTTLYAFLRQLNTSDVKIITIEDPIEYHLDGITQTQVDEDKEYTFLSGLRSVLRQDPDVIMVGEIRDEDTAKVATNAALTGHLVLSTLHTNNAAGTIPRLIDLKVNPKVISSALSLALAQRLVRKLCDHCKEPLQADEKQVRVITNILGDMVNNNKLDLLNGVRPNTSYELYKAVGCDQCSNGYKGRIGVYEVLVMTPEIERLMDKNPSERDIKDAALSQGTPTLREDAILKVLEGVTSYEEVSRVVDLYED